jgi:cytoskeletal protein CcmA (bactofilin family)
MRERLVNRMAYRMLAALLVVLVALAAAPHAWAAPVGKDVVDQNLVVAQGETLQGDVNVTNGDLTVYGTIDGKATIVNGKASIYGTVNGDLTVITGGNITLFAGSYVDGNVVDMGGEVVKDSAATITGSVGTIDNPIEGIGNMLNANQDQIGSAGAWADRMNPFNRMGSWLFLGGLSTVLLVFSVGLAALVPRRIGISSATLESEPGPSVAVGIIASILLAPIAGIITAALAITVIGIVLIPVVWIAVGVVYLYGFVIVAQWLGKRIHDSAHRPDIEAALARKSSQSAMLVMEVLLGAAAILACTILPAIFVSGWISILMLGMLYVLSCIGLGAGLLSKFGTLQPSKHRMHKRTVVYPTPHHNNYGSALVNAPITGPIHAHSNTRPLGPAPVLPAEKEER